jgi:Family of unknown function (DUF6152)
MQVTNGRRREGWLCGLLGTAAIAMSMSAFGHHSFAAYDGTRTRTLTGTVETVRWSNPHVEFKMLVTLDDGGDPQEWSIVTSSPAILARFGWTHDSLKPGDRVRAILNPMQDGSHSGRLHTVIMADTGKMLGTKLSDTDKPTAE